MSSAKSRKQKTDKQKRKAFRKSANPRAVSGRGKDGAKLRRKR